MVLNLNHKKNKQKGKHTVWSLFYACERSKTFFSKIRINILVHEKDNKNERKKNNISKIKSIKTRDRKTPKE